MHDIVSDTLATNLRMRAAEKHVAGAASISKLAEHDHWSIF